MRDKILAIIDRYEAEQDFSGVVLVRRGDDDVVTLWPCVVFCNVCCSS